MNLSSTTRRILLDVKTIMKNPLEENGIFYCHNEDNIYNGKAMIIGPSETPYFSGFYLFDILYPFDYPYSPPVITYCTQGENIRWNPNLYTNGKVCLSLLNTWAGDPWTSVQTISSVLLTMSSILNKNPLLNEPYIKEGDEKIKTYNHIITFTNIKIAYLGIFNKKYLPSKFEIFYNEIKSIFYENLEKIISFCHEKTNSLENQTELYVSIYNTRCYINYNELVKQLELIKKKIDIKSKD